MNPKREVPLAPQTRTIMVGVVRASVEAPLGEENGKYCKKTRSYELSKIAKQKPRGVVEYTKY